MSIFIKKVCHLWRLNPWLGDSQPLSSTSRANQATIIFKQVAVPCHVACDKQTNKPTNFSAILQSLYNKTQHSSVINKYQADTSNKQTSLHCFFPVNTTIPRTNHFLQQCLTVIQLPFQNILCFCLTLHYTIIPLCCFTSAYMFYKGDSHPQISSKFHYKRLETRCFVPCHLSCFFSYNGSQGAVIKSCTNGTLSFNFTIFYNMSSWCFILYCSSRYHLHNITLLTWTD